jgi:tetratricopeptide (TPR) repeat protein
MDRNRRGKQDPLEREIELAISPGGFIPDRACFSFVGDLEETATKIATLAKTDPARAAALYETFLAGCYEKVEELDDSSGSFGQFVGELLCGWIRARQAAGDDPDDAVARLLVWMDNDPYALSYGVEKDAVKAFDKVGLAAFERRIRKRFEAAASQRQSAGRAVEAESACREWGAVLRTIYVAQRNIAAYVVIAEQTGLTPADCHAVATLLRGRRKPEDALAWVERGLGIERNAPHESTAGHELARLRRELWTRLGRGDEALDAAWVDFRKHPSKYTYDDLMQFVPKSERASWHEKAIEAATGADLHSLFELFLETGELARLADCVRESGDAALEATSHYATEPVAEKLEKKHPDLAARLWRAQGMRIVDAKKSEYYHAALSNFERAKRCFERAGLAAEWEKTVGDVRARHHRKVGFIPGFERLVAGAGGHGHQQSFLERAKARWSKRQAKREA